MRVPQPVPQVFLDTTELLASIRPRTTRAECRLIAIDGVNGVGKSRVASQIAQHLSCRVIDCDNFIRDGKLFYPEILDLDSLSRAICGSLKTSLPVVVEGMALLSVLSATAMRPLIHIYIRHNWPMGVQTHETLLNPAYSEELLMGEENETCRAAGIPDDSPILARELITYHKRVRPHEVADAIVDVCFPIE